MMMKYRAVMKDTQAILADFREMFQGDEEPNVDRVDWLITNLGARLNSLSKDWEIPDEHHKGYDRLLKFVEVTSRVIDDRLMADEGKLILIRGRLNNLMGGNY